LAAVVRDPMFPSVISKTVANTHRIPSMESLRNHRRQPLPLPMKARTARVQIPPVAFALIRGMPGDMPL
jgi:hypothetical protein